MNHPRNLLVAAVSLLVGAAILSAQDAVAGDPVVVTAGDVTIRQSELESAAAALPAEYRAYASGPGRRQFAEDFLRMRLLARQAEKAGLAQDPAMVRQIALMKENLLASEQVKRMEAGIQVADAELQRAYQDNLSRYEQVSARHILIAFKGSPAQQASKPELTEEQAKAKADEVRQQLVGGASFEETAKKESDDVGSGASGGSLGAFGRGQMVPEFEAAAFEGKVGEISPVVRTQFGYHILRVDERSTTPFDQVRPMLERTLRSERLQQKLTEVQGAATPTYNDAYFGAAPATPATPAIPQP